MRRCRCLVASTDSRLAWRFSWLRCLLVGLELLAVSVGCQDSLGEPNPGRRIIGTVFYDGVVPDDLEAPGLFIAAVSEFPLSGAPHATWIIEAPDFSDGIPYELRDMPPYDYFVIARLRDLAAPIDPLEPFGAYPDFCSLQSQAAGNVSVTDDAVNRGIDIRLYADGGVADPCTVDDGDVCPAAGSSTVVAEISADIEPVDDDVLIFALFTSWPAEGLPARAQITPGSRIALPQTISVRPVGGDRRGPAS